MGAHAKFAPSAADIWLQCALYPTFAQRFPDTPTAASIRGTRKHHETARHLLVGDDAEADDVQMCLDYVRELPKPWRAERKVVIVEGKCWGTADFRSLRPKGMTVVDYKYGKKPVGATNNPQLILYGLGALAEHPLPPTANVDLVILQPNASSGMPVKEWSTPVRTLLDFRGKVEQAIERAERPNPQAVAGRHCYWCPGKLHCHEYLRTQGSNRSRR
jgi:hypothetical protein